MLIKDHFGKMQISSTLLTFLALKEFREKIIGCNLSNCVSYGENGFYSVYFSSEDVKYCEEIGNLFYSDINKVNLFIEQANSFLTIMDEYTSNELIGYNKKTVDKVVDIYRKTYELFIEHTAYFLLTNDLFSKNLWSKFVNSIDNVEDKNEVILCLSAVDSRDLYFYKELKNWLEICNYYYSESKQEDELISKVKIHAKTYGFLMRGTEADGINIETGADFDFYWNKLIRLSKSEYLLLQNQHNLILLKSENAFDWAHKCKKILKLDDEMFNIAQSISKIANLRLKMREVLVRFSSARAKNFMNHIREIFNSFKLKPNDIRFMTASEIENVLLNKLAFVDLSNEINDRQKAVYIELSEGEIKLLSGDTAKNVWEEISSSNVKDISEESMIGTPVYGSGVITGKVLNYDNKKHVGETDNLYEYILVAKTIRPNMVEVCMKAKGIVTEEGGFTSHASVLCREMRIPCIVGMPFAAEKFIDGESILIDLSKGIVKKATESTQRSDIKRNVFWLNELHDNESYYIGGKAKMLSHIKDFTPNAFFITKTLIDSILANDKIAIEELFNNILKLKSSEIAIRSSFATEDAYNSSHAGLFKSFINIKSSSKEDILNCIKEINCSYKTVPNYYSNDSINKDDVSIIIQKMLQADFSGVLLSSVIKDGYEYMIIEYTIGHLSSLVDGSIKPLRTYIKKAELLNDLKQRGKISVVNYSPPVLINKYDDYFASLCQQAIELEKKLCLPLELEWLINNDGLAILQARPTPIITLW